jgi:hypothetical protein
MDYEIGSHEMSDSPIFDYSSLVVNLRAFALHKNGI